MDNGGGGAGGLPGIGSNPRPLPPGLVPKAGVALPPGAVVPVTPPERGAPSPPQPSGTNSLPATSVAPIPSVPPTPAPQPIPTASQPAAPSPAAEAKTP